MDNYNFTLFSLLFMIMNVVLSPLQKWIFVFIKYSTILSNCRTQLNLHKPRNRM
jgi:hypothetical protein